MGVEWSIWQMETGKCIVRVPGVFLDHSRTLKPKKINQKYQNRTKIGRNIPLRVSALKELGLLHKIDGATGPNVFLHFIWVWHHPGLLRQATKKTIFWDLFLKTFKATSMLLINLFFVSADTKSIGTSSNGKIFALIFCWDRISFLHCLLQ